MSTLTPEIEKYLQQRERKREYDKRYYQERTKPKKQQMKSELEILKDRCAMLEAQLQSEESYVELADKYNDLYKQYMGLLTENKVLREAVDHARQRNYELAAEHAPPSPLTRTAI